MARMIGIARIVRGEVANYPDGLLGDSSTHKDRLTESEGGCHQSEFLRGRRASAFPISLFTLAAALRLKRRRLPRIFIGMALASPTQGVKSALKSRAYCMSR